MHKVHLFITFMILNAMNTIAAQTDYPVETLVNKDGDKINITLFKHASLAIEYKGVEIYVDPVTKVADTSIDYTRMPKADYILITHENWDHLDSVAGCGAVFRFAV